MNIFEAGVQYNDFSGTVAADVSDNIALLNDLKKAGLANEDDQLVAIRMGSSENQGVEVHDAGVVCYLAKSTSFNPRPSDVRAVEYRLSPAKLLSFFKRFDLVMSRKGVDLSSATVDGPHYG